MRPLLVRIGRRVWHGLTLGPPLPVLSIRQMRFVRPCPSAILGFCTLVDVVVMLCERSL